jgi:hypothetical protein
MTRGRSDEAGIDTGEFGPFAGRANTASADASETAMALPTRAALLA